MNPLLSICVPTFNRAKLLEKFLLFLEAEVAPLGDKVEVVVSDNCSPDNTAEVVQAAQKRYPISYRRLPRNMGGAHNIVTIVTEVSKGKYCWVLGDDDLLRPHSVAKILGIIEGNPDIPYIFVNHSYESDRERGKFSGATGALSTFDADRLLCHDLEEKKVERWENIVFCGNAPALFTAIVCHVFLKDIWVRRASTLGSLEFSTDRELTYELVFPHVAMLASELVGRPVYYIGFPCVMLFVGAQEWFGIWPKYLFTFVLRIADQMEQGGASPEAVERYRSLIFKRRDEFQALVVHNKSARAKGGDWTKWRFKKEDDFSLPGLFVRHWKNREFQRLIAWTCLRTILAPIAVIRRRLMKSRSAMLSRQAGSNSSASS